MSELKLDAWSDATIIGPIFQASRAWYESQDERPYAERAIAVKEAIRQKVLESYRNGQKAGPRRFQPRR
jgi:hypothetical protein